MTCIICSLVGVLLIVILFALIYGFKKNKSNSQSKNTPSGGKSKKDNTRTVPMIPIKIGWKFVLDLTLSLSVTITSVVIVTNPDVSSLEKCTVLICLTLLTGVIILSTTLYKLHSEKIALERDLSYETYSRNLKRETVKYPSKDIVKSETDSSDSDNLELFSENKQ